MVDVQVYIWDVERGDAILIKGPDENVVIDMGKHSSGFSPAEQIERHGVSDIGYLSVSHPDADHINNIVEFFNKFDPTTFGRPKSATPYIEHRKDNIHPNDDNYQEIAGKYLEVTNRYTVSPTTGVGSSSRNSGLTFKSYNLTPTEVGIKPARMLDNDEDPNLNDLSRLTIMEYGGFKLVTAGDLETDAIEEILKKDGVQDDLEGTNVLIAPHHGRTSSYCSELFNHITPDIVAISDAAAGSTNASSRYSSKATGITVERRNGNPTTRSTITTRKDGVLYFGIDETEYKAIID
jgi:competence protein ComEC